MLLVGIDEAGLGPLLGPLVVSATAFSAPPEIAGVSMWKLLAGAVSRKASARRSSIAIGDSKKLFDSAQRDKGLRNLERGVLTMLAGRGQCPASLRQLLDMVSPGAGRQTSLYPWYADIEAPLPAAATALDITLSGNALAAAMQRCGIALELMRAETVLEGEYNRHVQATDNKSVTLFDITARLLAHLWQSWPDQEMRIVVDRQGGRMRYLPNLQRIFEGGGCRFKIIDETETLSAYRITAGQRVAEICFMVAAEDQHLPVALASMLSKYIRELFMGLFNDYWAGKVPGILPTAGYHVDGTRFLEQILPVARQMGLDPSLFHRSR